MSNAYIGTNPEAPPGYTAIPINPWPGLKDVEVPADQSDEPESVETSPITTDIEDENPDDMEQKKKAALAAGIATARKSGRTNINLTWRQSPEQGTRELIKRSV